MKHATILTAFALLFTRKVASEEDSNSSLQYKRGGKPHLALVRGASKVSSTTGGENDDNDPYGGYDDEWRFHPWEHPPIEPTPPASPVL